MRKRFLAFCCLLAVPVLLPACEDDASDPRVQLAAAAPAPPAPAAPPVWLDSARRAEEHSIYMDAARAAWRFADRNYVARTGLFRPLDGYGSATMWDIASGLAALHAAGELELIPHAEYTARMTRALETLRSLPLFDDVSFNKEYATESGLMIGVERTPSRRGYGISATDTGRLLVWLKIIAQNQPEFRPIVDEIVARIDFDELIEDGYLYGQQLSRRTGRVRPFQEGRIGYEQYAATGFDLWDHAPEHALDITHNAEIVEISGVKLLRDRRGDDRLTSEPFILLGLEVGWTPVQRDLAANLLAAMEQRAEEVGRPVIVSEDAINIAPDYFFYNTVLSKHGPWSIDVQRPRVQVTEPRWLSTKATFAWHALLPGDYTRTALDTIRSTALTGGVWGSGVFDDGRATGNPNINTAAVVLEAALFRMRGGPLVEPRGVLQATPPS